MGVDFRVYLITDRKVSTKPLPEAVRLALEGGVMAVQLREKDLPVRELLALAKELRSITKEFGVKLFINDRVDVAVAVHADGVHLGGQSMPPLAVRQVVGDDMLIGVSTHSREEAWSAETEGADFITFGPIYATPSKDRYGKPVGLNALKSTIEYITIPIYALGGIKSGNIYEIIQHGVYGIAMISGILSAFDIRKAAEETTRMIQRTLAGERP
ncbi:MAG TPA: thiamine phosphate synthase [Nitrospirota bacterium]|nr:thiamine phosphate synthase [Nitrospirota bacterium]